MQDFLHSVYIVYPADIFLNPIFQDDILSYSLYCGFVTNRVSNPVLETDCLKNSLIYMYHLI